MGKLYFKFFEESEFLNEKVLKQPCNIFSLWNIENRFFTWWSDISHSFKSI